MRIIALLSWYDENPLWLERCVRSLVFAGVDELYALDGAYDLYPDGQSESDPSQHQAITRAADAVGIKWHLDTPLKVWDTEIDKRNHLFWLAENTSEPDDWYMIVDSDEFVADAPQDLHERLDQPVFNVGAIVLNEPGHPQGTITFPAFPMFFRAIRGLRVVGNHFTYMTPDGRYLWGDATRNRLEARLETGVTVEHHKELRDPDRRKAANAYYVGRDDAGIEQLQATRYLVTP